MKKIWILFFLPVLFSACIEKEPAPRNNTLSDNNLVSITSKSVFTPYQLSAATAETPMVAEGTGDNQTIQELASKAIDLITFNRVHRLDTLFSGHAVMKEKNREWQIESYTFTYRTIAANGQPVTLSGRVSFPNAKDTSAIHHQVSSISLYTHHYLVNKAHAPAASVQIVDMRTLYNSVVVSPDYQGYGSTENLPYCGYSFDAQARQAADCINAALIVMRQQGVTLADDSYTTAWGFSLAAPVTLAFARYYDQKMTNKQRDMVNLRSVYIGEGPYFLDTLIHYYNNHPDFTAFALDYSPIYLAALPRALFGKYSMTDFLPQWMQTQQVEIDGETISYIEAMKKNHGVWNYWPEGLSHALLVNHFADDMRTEDNHLDLSNPKTTFILDMLHNLSDWDGWTPTMPIFMYHSRNDNSIPYEQAYNFYNYLRDKGAFVYWKDCSTKLLESYTTAHVAGTILGTVNSVLHEDPRKAHIFTN